MNHIEELFSEQFQPEFFKLIDKFHPLALYIGADADGNPAIEFAGDFKPVQIRTASAIEVTHLKRKDGKIAIVFSLLDASMLSTFCAFCEDLVNSTRNASDDLDGYRMLLNRYYAWKKMFRQKSSLLSESEIMGLIGELMYLKDELIPKYGKSKSLSSWTGSEKTRKDFSIDDTWMEIKVISVGKETATISSFEQLDSDRDGHLVVFQLEKMSPEYDGITIKKMAHNILNLLEVDALKDQFLQKLAEIGYVFENEYDNYVYNKCSMTSYIVSQDFPCLRRLPEFEAILQVKYDLLLSMIEPYKE